MTMPPPSSRRAAKLVWTTLLVLPLAFLAVVSGLRAPGSGASELATMLFWIAIAASAFDLALSRLLPPRLRPSASGREAVVFSRLLVSWALCEAAALFPLVAFILTGDPRLVGVFAVDLAALVLLYPSDARWESLAPEAAPGAPRRMVR
jgi:hypothetical protein